MSETEGVFSGISTEQLKSTQSVFRGGKDNNALADEISRREKKENEQKKARAAFTSGGGISSRMRQVQEIPVPSVPELVGEVPNAGSEGGEASTQQFETSERGVPGMGWMSKLKNKQQ